MGVSSDDFLNAAEELLKNAKVEIDIRNSISRAYYAGYHEADELAKNKNIQIIKTKVGAHQSLINAFTSNSDVNFRKIGYILQQCKNERTVADYHLSDPVDSVRANNVINQIKKIQAIIKTIP